MADDQEKLTIAISAVDNASAVLKELAGNVNDASSQIKTGNEQAGTSFGTLVGSIFTAEAAYELLKKGLEMVKDFFEESIGAALEASKTMVQVQVDVKNAGLSYDQLAPQIDAVAKKNELLGFTHEETALSIGKAILSTGNYSDAIKLNKLAMDLSVAKNMDLTSATTLLNQVMAGNTRVLKSYGISLDSASTSADALNIVQKMVGGSAEALSGTPAGSVRAMQAQWEGMREEIGSAFLPAITQVFNLMETHLPQIEEAIKTLVGIIQGSITVVEDFATAFDILTSSISKNTEEDTRAAKNRKALMDGIVSIFKPIDDARKANEAATKAQNDYNASTQKLVDAYNAVHKGAVITIEDLQKVGSDGRINMTLLKEASKDLSDQTKQGSTNFDDFANRITKADNAVMKHSDAIEKLSTDYQKMKDQGTTAMAELTDSFVSKMKTMTDATNAAQKAIDDLTASYNKTRADDTASVAESIVASEQKIADIKKQLSEATSATETENLNEQLAKEQANYDSSLAFRQANVAAMTAAEARGQETDLQRAIDDYNAKKALDDKAYQDKLVNLQKDLKDKQDAANAEILQYNNKMAQINKIMQAGNVYFKQLSDQRLATTTAEVNAEIAQFQALTAAINASKAASASALSTINVPVLGGAAHHEAGGFVNAPRGTAVPIIAHGGEQIIPAEQSAGQGGGNVTVVIQNPTVRRDSDLDDIRASVEEVFRSVLINHKVVHI